MLSGEGTAGGSRGSVGSRSTSASACTRLRRISLRLNQAIARDETAGAYACCERATAKGLVVGDVVGVDVGQAGAPVLPGHEVASHGSLHHHVVGDDDPFRPTAQIADDEGGRAAAGGHAAEEDAAPCHHRLNLIIRSVGQLLHAAAAEFKAVQVPVPVDVRLPDDGRAGDGRVGLVHRVTGDLESLPGGEVLPDDVPGAAASLTPDDDVAGYGRVCHLGRLVGDRDGGAGGQVDALDGAPAGFLPGNPDDQRATDGRLGPVARGLGHAELPRVVEVVGEDVGRAVAAVLPDDE